MNIQKKTSIVLLIVLSFYLIFLIYINKNIWDKKLTELDKLDATKHMYIVKNLIDKESETISLILKDYARWDVTYNFVENKNKNYIDINYNGVDTKIFSYIGIYNKKKNKIISFKIDKNGKILYWNNLPNKFNNNLIFSTNIENIKKGIVYLNNKLILIAIAPILKTNGIKNENGYLIFGKDFNEDIKKHIQKESESKCMFINIFKNSDFEKNKILIKNIENNGNIFYEILNKKIIRTYTIIYDIYGKPTLIVTIDTIRKIQISGEKAQNSIIVSTFILVLILMLIFYRVVKYGIIDPLNVLKKIFRNIYKNNEISYLDYKKLINKKDEISELTEEFYVMNNKILELNNNLENTVKERTSELRRANENLRLVEKIIENTTEGIIVTNLDGIIIKVNKGFLNMNLFTLEEVIGKNPKIVKSGKHSDEFYKEMWLSIKNNGSWEGEIWNRRKDGGVYPKWLTINTIYDENEVPVYYVGIMTDISKLKDVETKLNHLAYYDSLTELPNRVLFNERLNQSIKFNKRYSSNLAVFFIDLDRFKIINDTLGHSLGDKYLIEISKRLKSRMRESDTVCRIGGDEFLIIVDKFYNINDVTLVASDILKIIELPVVLANKEISSTASLGISLFPDDDDNIDGLVRKADSAMYQAKNTGRGNYKFFSQEIEDKNNAKLELETKLKKALEENRMELYFQPQINIEKYLNNEPSLIGCEALIRWRKEDGSLIYPDEFIPIAEETGLIIPIGKWVLEEVCNSGAKWYQKGIPIRISANVSSLQFDDKNFLKYLDDALVKSELPTELLHLELTESTLLNNIEETVKILDKIKERGIFYSIDDFGTGYSSLSYIKELSASNLKIDKAFIFKMNDSNEDKTIVQAIISIAKTFGMKTLAEGVETRNHLEELNIMGCEEIQGYFISKPLSKKDFEEFIIQDINKKNRRE